MVYLFSCDFKPHGLGMTLTEISLSGMCMLMHTRSCTHTHIHTHTLLTQSVSGDTPYREAAVGCLDLLLRWITLRFFETNTSINLKCLELLHALFKMLLQVDSFRMSDYEANAFLPYLVQKVTDSSANALCLLPVCSTQKAMCVSYFLVLERASQVFQI